MEEKRFQLQGTDEMEESVTRSASIIADEYFKQIGMPSVAENHDDSWFDLQEELISAMFKASVNVLSNQ